MPQGYKVSAEALKKIETSVANECGEFTVKATAGNSVSDPGKNPMQSAPMVAIAIRKFSLNMLTYNLAAVNLLTRVDEELTTILQLIDSVSMLSILPSPLGEKALGISSLLYRSFWCIYGRGKSASRSISHTRVKSAAVLTVA